LSAAALELVRLEPVRGATVRRQSMYTKAEPAAERAGHVHTSHQSIPMLVEESTTEAAVSD